MTDYDRHPDQAHDDFDATMGGYVHHANPSLEPDYVAPEPVNRDHVGGYEQAPNFDEPVDWNSADWQPENPVEPGWRTGSHAPASDVPSYELLNREPASHEAPSYDEAGYEAPTYDEAGYEAPTYDEPSYEAPSYDEPSYEAPSYHEELGQEAVGHTPSNWGASHEVLDPAGATFEEQGFEASNFEHQPSWDAEWEMPADPALADRATSHDGDDPESQKPKDKSGLGASAFFIGFLSLAIVVLAAAAFLAFKLADREPAGPETPEEAVAVLLEALAAEDALGMAESILPSERESLIEPTLALVEELKRVGLLSEDTDLNNISGVDITTNGLTMEIEEVDRQIRWVTLNGGTIDSAGSAADLPMAGSGISADLSESIDFSVDPVSFAVVEENGSWYPSIWYTVAETARRDSDLPRPSLSRQPIGSSTPSEAVARFVNAASGMRPGEMLTAMDPVEMRAAYDYSSLFISDLDSAALELRREIRADGSTWNLASLDTSVTEGGDKALVSIDGFVLTGTQGLSDPFAVSFDAGCLTFDLSGPVETICRGEEGFPEIATQLRVVKRDGQWFVSGAPNLIYPYVDYLRTLETNSIPSFGDLLASTLGSGFNPAGLNPGGLGAIGGELPDSPGWTPAFTVDQSIPAGTPASQMAMYLVFEDLPSDLLPAGAIVNMGQIAGLEAAMDIPEGSVLSASMLREPVAVDPPIDENNPDGPVIPNPNPAPSIAEPVEAELFPSQAIWTRVDSSTSAVFDINPGAREPLWVAERTDGSAIIQITKLADSRETRALDFNEFLGWQRARNIEYPAYANSQYAVVVVGNYVVVSLDPLDDSGILLEQARYLAKQIR